MQTIVSLPLQPWPYCLICLHVRCFVSFARSPVFSRWWQFVVQFIAVTLVKLKILLANFKIMPSLFSSISFLRLNPKNVVFSQQINVLPLYTATLGFRHSYCTQTYNVLLQTQWCRHNSVWLCIGLVQKCNYLSQGESGPIVWTPQRTGYTYGAISCTAVSKEFAARNGQAIVTLRCVLF